MNHPSENRNSSQTQFKNQTFHDSKLKFMLSGMWLILNYHVTSKIIEFHVISNTLFDFDICSICDTDGAC